MDRRFIAEVKKELFLRQLEYKDLATATGYSISTIKAFMCGGRNSSDLKHKIASALDIKINEENTSEGSDRQCYKND